VCLCPLIPSTYTTLRYIYLLIPYCSILCLNETWKISQFWLAKSNFFEIRCQKRNTATFLIFYFSNFLIFLISKCMWLTQVTAQFFMYIINKKLDALHSCNFDSLWKTHSCMVFFPNCTRNHTIIPTNMNWMLTSLSKRHCSWADHRCILW
jgi:hypothetical protein